MTSRKTVVDGKEQNEQKSGSLQMNWLKMITDIMLWRGKCFVSYEESERGILLFGKTLLVSE